MIKIKKTSSNFEREPLLKPFGFKGGYLSELWQTIAVMKSENDNLGLGLGTQSPLWSDAQVFLNNSESGGNAMMFLATQEALKQAEGMEFESPVDLFEKIVPLVYDYAKKVTTRNDLRLTFALNAMVAVDNAAWMLYAKENNLTSFDEMIPEEIRPALSLKHKKLANIPLFTYGVTGEEISKAVDDGFFFAKIKIGADPDKDGSQEKMLEWDKNRITEIHNLLKDRKVEWTDNGHIPYYLDANGRYDSKDRLKSLLDHADSIGALERILLIEEPFPEEYKVDVSDLPVRIAADESLHSIKDAEERLDLGYGALTLKPIAKTMTLSLLLAKLGAERNIPCFCADLTVNPVLVDWNKAVASRIAPLPGVKVGVLESNGHQNYTNWQKMLSYHPGFGSEWVAPKDGMFNLNDDYYNRSGCILDIPQHYLDQIVID
jgi:L-alanine-DL-glutamate epimerase-like enolase superfamily enzyme